MNCDDCREAQSLDGVIPPCETEQGCWIPAPLPSVMRALEIHQRLRQLKDLGIGGEVLRLYEATRLDLMLIGEAEDELRELNSSPVPDDEPGTEEEVAGGT